MNPPLEKIPIVNHAPRTAVSGAALARIAALAILAILVCHLAGLVWEKKYLSSQRLPASPWRCVGGCGAGGSGAGGGATVKWVGNGVSGGLIDVQSLGGYNLFRDHSIEALTTRLSIKPTNTTQLALTVPILDKAGSVQPSTLYPRQFEQAGGIGDLMLDGTVTFGMQGEYSLMLAVGFPTGQYNIVRGTDQISYVLPSASQLGAGLTVPALTLSYSRDVQNGIWLVDLTYTHPMALRIFSGKNEFLGSYFKDYKDSTSNRRFYYRVKPYGENDLGDYTPPSVSASVCYGIKEMHDIMPSLGLTFSAPLGVAWIHNSVMNGSVLSYDPKPDPDHLAWSAQIVYGMEFEDPKRPLYLAVIKPIHDIKDAQGKWNGPDMQAFVNEWGIVLGIKATMF